MLSIVVAVGADANYAGYAKKIELLHVFTFNIAESNCSFPNLVTSHNSIKSIAICISNLKMLRQVDPKTDSHETESLLNWKCDCFI